MGVDEDGCGPSLLFALFPGGSPRHLPTSCLIAPFYLLRRTVRLVARRLKRIYRVGKDPQLLRSLWGLR